ncbi:macro domain-containing protein [Nonomuraea sp. NPDC049646]|uniref:macro domain-containing protein n=1 Tax=unclassified Nonomuraea TaxID=2593643 RepID=UPI0037A2A8E0
MIQKRASWPPLVSWSLIAVWVRAFLLLLGVLAGLAGLLDALFPKIFEAQGWAYLALIFGTAALGGLVQAWPRSTFQKYFAVPGTTITLLIGDLFDQNGHLIIGMNDVFDTEVPALIKATTVQGQLLEREFEGDRGRLDRELARALSGAQVETIESRQSKPAGKRRRYKLGTVAVIGDGNRRYFCSAYARMDNSGVVQASADGLWLSMSELWGAVRSVAQQDVVSMPVIGSGLARLTGRLSYVDLVRLTILSFISASRDRIVTRELRIVLHPKDLEDIDFRDIAALLRAH